MCIEKAFYVFCNCGKTTRYDYNDNRIKAVKTSKTLVLTMPPCSKCERVKTYSSETDNGVTLKMLLNWLIRKDI